MKYLSLFSGIGGFELGIKQAYEANNNQPTSSIEQDWKGRDGNTDVGSALLHDRSNAPLCVGFSEIDKYAIQIYQSHFPEHKNYGDITKINEKELPDFDLLIGGFPCQSFSIAGKRGGFEDTRGTLFFEISRILRHKQPRLFLLENVKGLLSHDNGGTFKAIITTLDELGYDLQWQVLNSKDFGVPQNRERVFIVGHLRGTSRPEVFPVFGNSSKDFCPTLRATYYKGYQTRGVMINEGNSQIRRLTPKECERLQGFPDGWTEGVSDTQRYKCLGNAVTVNVIQAIIEKLT